MASNPLSQAVLRQVIQQAKDGKADPSVERLDLIDMALDPVTGYAALA